MVIFMYEMNGENIEKNCAFDMNNSIFCSMYITTQYNRLKMNNNFFLKFFKNIKKITIYKNMKTGGIQNLIISLIYEF